ncbi:hypothetical protein TorRG33x02_355270 [Trema orientale]|uniref:Uncharacterized protein n=1 Tax=Trema orientale TaxID=63057 RepID=A0A2P5A9L2_TREOI|nr:hypothetical protein TorRG33x02_355270 [Trema orientale]
MRSHRPNTPTSYRVLLSAIYLSSKFLFKLSWLSLNALGRNLSTDHIVIPILMKGHRLHH